MAEANVAVLIDYENVGLDPIQPLLDQLSDVGRTIVKRAYADWSAAQSKRDQLLELGIEAVHHFRSTKSGKNSSDICLAIDAVNLLYEAPVDTFVIVSSDSDFVPLVSKLRSAGKAVIGAGRKDGTSPTLVKSCDRYIYLDDNKPNKDPRRRRTRSRASDGASLVVRSMEASMDDQGKVLGSKLYQTMQRIDPSFNFRALGHRTFAQFLTSSQAVEVTRPKDASDLIVQMSGGQENGSASAPSADPPPTNGAAQTNGTPQTNGAPPSDWDREIDNAWTARNLGQISGRAAAADAAKVLGVPKLSASRYPSLDKLLAASEALRSRWHREGNYVTKQ